MYEDRDVVKRPFTNFLIKPQGILDDIRSESMHAFWSGRFFSYIMFDTNIV